MYIPAHFREERDDVLREAMRRYSFATLVTGTEEGVEANHLPLLVEGDMLSGHFARANPVWKALKPGAEALAIFMGPHFYTSPNWYPSKAQTGKGVPTWNYITVHARGAITLHEDTEWLRGHVGRLADIHEAGQPRPWKLEEAPKDYIEGLLGAIVGFELKITKLEGKWKLSQNRVAADIEGVRQALKCQGRGDLADLMRS